MGSGTSTPKNQSLVMYSSEVVSSTRSPDDPPSVTSKEMMEFATATRLEVPNVEALLQLFDSPKLCYTFFRFLNSEACSENLIFYQQVEALKKERKNSESDLNITGIKRIFEDFIRVGSASEINVNSQLRKRFTELVNSISSPDSPALSSSSATAAVSSTESAAAVTYAMRPIEEMADLLDKMQSEVVNLMALGPYPRFILSKMYIDWQRDTMDSASIAAAAKSVQQEVTSRLMAKLNTFHISEADATRPTGDWLARFCALIEYAPMSIVISDARRDNMHFPIIYANDQFEKMTGYERSEFIGRNCKFLQGALTEKDPVERMSAALSQYKPIDAVLITNYRKCGEAFQNLIYFKPVVDEAGETVYIVSINHDVTDPKSLLLHRDSSTTTNILAKIPDKISTKKASFSM